MSPRITAPRQITASNRFVPAKVFATSGFKCAGHAHDLDIFRYHAVLRQSSTQLLNSLLVTNLLNLETTIPNFNPVAL